MRYISLFSGIGGFELGIAAARPDWQCVAVVEKDAAAARVLAVRTAELAAAAGHPPPLVLRDVTEVDGPVLERLLTGGPIDLVVGGPPCTDISSAAALRPGGARGGLEGVASGLAAHYFRIVAALRARHVLMENVCSMRLADREALTRGLGVALGRPVHMTRMDSAPFTGQQRRRLYWSSWPLVPPAQGAAAAQGLFHAALLRVEELARRWRAAPPEQRAADLVTATRRAAYMARMTGGKPRWTKRLHQDTCTPVSRTLPSALFKGQPCRIIVDRRPGFPAAMQVELGEGGGPVGGGLAGCGGSGSTAVVRFLEVAEVEALQGFPVGWTGVPGNALTRAMHQLGNAVTPHVVAYVVAQFPDGTGAADPPRLPPAMAELYGSGAAATWTAALALPLTSPAPADAPTSGRHKRPRSHSRSASGGGTNS